MRTVDRILTSYNSALKTIKVLNAALIISRANRQKLVLSIKNHLILAFSSSSGKIAT